MSALWGNGSKRGDGSRSSALWGKGGRRAGVSVLGAITTAVVLSVGVAMPASAGSKPGALPSTFVPASLVSQAAANPKQSFNLIVQGNGSQSADKVAGQIARYALTADGTNATVGNSSAFVKAQVRHEFSSIDGVAVRLTGRELTNLLKKGSAGLMSVTVDAPVGVSGSVQYSSSQLWPYESNVSNVWGRDKNDLASNQPTIAVVDSGIENRADFGSRLLASVNLSSLPNNSPGDGRGHGTFVAGIAAGGLSGVTGADPAANLVSLDVLDDTGMGMTSDIIAACQWILDNKAQYNIKVANFSLHSDITAPFYIDPLDRAVEQLWFNGVTVVAAAGNYGSAAGPSGVLYSPGDDPFVITVGAADINGSTNPNKATMAPWSAWGSTIDGFGKPELSAPGRYMIGPVPAASTLVAERPANVTSPGYMQLSGTSFAAPVVSGAAANILAAHPDWTPDQVKGALMLTATGLPSSGAAGGVGVIQANKALSVGTPPNPNAGLDQFVTADPTAGSGYSFNGASWNSTALSNASWDSASWDSASWNSASWNSASWNSVSWNSASWNSASWNSASWNSASWNSASWNSASWNSASVEDAAEGDNTANTAQIDLSTADVAALLADPGFDPTTLPAWLVPPTTP
jgi:serine protease AprX